MGAFKRGLNPAALNALSEMAGSSTPNWWTDLLGLWAPSGSAKGERRLRLAVRDNYLNFYLNGQSVARVAFDSQSRPRVEVHVKYAFDDAIEQAYAKLTGTEVRHPNSDQCYAYAGRATLREWMARAGAWETVEKIEVERLVANNASVIDLEMGLPAHAEQNTALRMDLVVLEPDIKGARLVFWEAKRVTDARLKSRSGLPEVMTQIGLYSKYLDDADHRKAVIGAYRKTCQTLRAFVAMAERSADVKLHLDPLVLLAAEDDAQVSIDGLPRLVIFGTEEQLTSSSWKEVHEAKLRNLGVQLLLLRTDAYRLPNRHPDTDIPA